MKKLSCIFALIPLLWSCYNHSTANISTCINETNTRITISQLNATSQILLDTLRTDAKGCFYYKVKFKQAEPMFLLIKTDSVQIATLLIEQGEKVQLTADLKNQHYEVEGSEGSQLLQELNLTFSRSIVRFDSLNRVLQDKQGAKNYDEIYKQINLELGKVYVRQKRDALRFIYNNPSSFASIAALYQKYPSDLPVFSAPNDALYFKMLYDTLQPKYPHSEYMIALHDEYEYRMKSDAMRNMFNEGLSELGFPDLNMPDITAQKIKLSSLKGKVILVYFWLSTNTAQRMENNELRNLYDKYSSKGFEIYQIALDTDKPVWAKQIKEQNHPWINVCDGFGSNSLAAKMYNISTLPTSYLIDQEGQIVAKQIFGKELEKQIAALIK